MAPPQGEFAGQELCADQDHATTKPRIKVKTKWTNKWKIKREIKTKIRSMEGAPALAAGLSQSSGSDSSNERETVIEREANPKLQAVKRRLNGLNDDMLCQISGWLCLNELTVLSKGMNAT